MDSHRDGKTVYQCESAGDGGGVNVSDSAGTFIYTRTGRKTGRINFIDAINGPGIINVNFTSISSMTCKMTRGKGSQAGTFSVTL